MSTGAEGAADAIGVFEGLRVIEIGQFVAAPVAAELLAHGGADVVRIEPVDGDVTRRTDPLRMADPATGAPQRDPETGRHRYGEGRQYFVKARGKRAIPLDLRSERGRALAAELVAGADVLITNLRPGTAARLGLDYETLGVMNPRLIVGEITGYGDGGPHAARPALDLIAQSWVGLRLASGVSRDGDDGPYEAFFCDYVAGLLLAFAVVGALHHRNRTGEGQRVTTSLIQAALFVQHRSASLFDATDEWKRALVIRRVAGDDLVDLLKYRADRVAPDLFFMRTYPTRDGAVAVGAIGPMIDTFCRLFGVVDPRQSEAWADRSQRRRLLADAQAAAGERLAAMSSVEAVVLLQEADIPAAPVRFLEEALVDADLFAAGLLYRAEDPALGGYTMPSPPVSFGKARYEAATTVPGHGQHTDVLLAELGYEQDTINRLVADGIVARAVGEDAPAEGEEGG